MAIAMDAISRRFCAVVVFSGLDFGVEGMKARVAGGLQWRGSVVSRLRCESGSRSNSKVVVTRESGKNGKLIKALTAKGVSCLEVPLIEHTKGPDLSALSRTLRDDEYEWIVVTSPEGATVFLEEWREAGSPEVRIAVVGAGTGQVFQEIAENERPRVEFTPSKSTGKILAVELPRLPSGNGKILYPSSAKAGSDLETGLSERGFEVTRLNTYSTESVRNLDQEKVSAARTAGVATFASPTAVKAWVELIGPWSGAVACIGVTSAQAAKKAGLNRVFYPESPGIDGWVESVMEALDSQAQNANVV